MSESELLVVMVTVPDGETAGRIAGALLNARLAACVNRISGVQSVFLWQGKPDAAVEELLIIKTTGSAFAEVESLVASLHPYECPEVLALPVARVRPSYGAWVRESVGGGDPRSPAI